MNINRKKRRDSSGKKKKVVGDSQGKIIEDAREDADADGYSEPEERREVIMDAGEVDGTQDIPEEYRDSQGNFKMMPVPRHLGSLTRRRPPLAVVVGVAGCGKSRLSSALLGTKENYRAILRVGSKTVSPKLVVGERLSVLDTPGLPDPFPRSSDTYYNDTVMKLRAVGYANAILFVVNQERVTPTLIKNYGILYRVFNKLPCVKLFVLRRDSSFVAQSMADQAIHEEDSRQVVNGILEATDLRRWETKQFFMWTKGSGEEQDKQIKYIREEVAASPRIDITATAGLQLTTEVAAAALLKAEALARASELATGGTGASKKAAGKAASKKAETGKAASKKGETGKAASKKGETGKAASKKAGTGKAASKKTDTGKQETPSSPEGDKPTKSGCSLM